MQVAEKYEHKRSGIIGKPNLPAVRPEERQVIHVITNLESHCGRLKPASRIDQCAPSLEGPAKSHSTERRFCFPTSTIKVFNCDPILAAAKLRILSPCEQIMN